MEPVVTADLSAFGYRELHMAAQLLNALSNGGRPDNMGDGLTINMNTNSGYVFLSDEDFNTFMMNGDRLEQHYFCSWCGWEGFEDEAEDEHKMAAWGNEITCQHDDEEES